MFQTLKERIPVLVFACILSGTLPLAAQQPPAPAPPALQNLGAQAVHVIVSQEMLNPDSHEPGSPENLLANGSWQVSPQTPAACANTTQPCVGILYRVPKANISCEWVVLLSRDGSQGTILEQNSDASKYLIQNVAPDRARDMVLKQNLPDYPPIAKAAHVSGEVILAVIVDTDGKPAKVAVLSGPEMLRFTAVQAMKTWLFKPLKIGSSSVPFHTTVEFTFRTTGPQSASVTSKP